MQETEPALLVASQFPICAFTRQVHGLYVKGGCSHRIGAGVLFRAGTFDETI